MVEHFRVHPNAAPLKRVGGCPSPTPMHTKNQHRGVVFTQKPRLFA